MAEKNMDLGTTVGSGLVAAGLVAVPAFGGQVVSGLLQAMFDEVAAFALDDFGQAVVDLGGGLIVGAIEVGIASAIGGKRLAAQTAPFAVAGAVLGAAVPLMDKAAKSIVSSLASAPGMKPVMTGKTPLQLVQQAAGGILVSPQGSLGGVVAGGGLGMRSRGAAPNLGGTFM